ncbi:MAG TPA: NAD(P)-dependent oxidoreductase [Steroidobacteraceae bacterium]
MTLKVVLLGLGIMGSGMARQLLAHGFVPTVWNRDSSKTAALREAGAQVATSAAQAVREADVAVAMLASDIASRNVWIDSGALAGMKPDAIVIESSTLTVDWSRELAVAATAHALRFLDAPVTGSKLQAHSGSLRFLVGGDAGVLARARPVVEAMGSFIHVGPQGSGTLLKLINNFVCGVQVASFAEALAMIERSGFDVKQAVEVLTAGAPGSPLIKTVAQRMLERAYEPQFLAPLMAKDLAYAGEAFSAAGLTSALAEAARERYLAATNAGLGQKDISAIVEPLRK